MVPALDYDVRGGGDETLEERQKRLSILLVR
jgi:hypothetical protein